MSNAISNSEYTFLNNISGFHELVLKNSVHLCFVSQSLCKMLDMCEQELLSETEDLYAERIHPMDIEMYKSCLRELSDKESSLTLQYRIIKKDGSILFVNDNISSSLTQDRTMHGYSVLTDITSLKAENQNIKYLNDTMPCGFIKYTCEKKPKITYINDKMLEMLHVSKAKDSEVDYYELSKNNIYLMIPEEDRRRFSMYLNRVYAQNTPLAGEMTIRRFDGTKGHFWGWVVKSVDEQGIEEFQSVLMDVSERYYKQKEAELNRYICALTDVYDMIFEYNLSSKTVRCLYGQKSEVFKRLEDIPMEMKEATERWANNTVLKEDRESFIGFFNRFWNHELNDIDRTPPQIKYRAFTSAGELNSYTGMFLKIDDSINLFCCRNSSQSKEKPVIKTENVQSFTDGIAAFEVIGEYVTPLYASDNVYGFFGYTNKEWLSLMKRKTPLHDFVAHSEVPFGAFLKLFESGEAEFTYFDLESNKEKRIKTICSKKSPDDNSSSFVMMYQVNNQNDNLPCDSKEVTIRSFGYFDVFVKEKPIAFKSQKAKELLAILVDRRGGFVTSNEAISFLWPDEPSNTVTLSRYRKVALRLKNILEEYGISDIIESVDGKRRIITEKVNCDLFNYLSGKEEYSLLFKGSYLSNYEWGETTLGELTGEGIH